ncbi:MAG TPA: EthD family reductase [Hydrogenophaga sp.]|nr:EthD family reductase [Hydrogenophaga sp.]
MSPTTPSPKLAKVTGIYRWTDGAHFDHGYYGTAHARLTTDLLSPLGLLRFESDRTVSEGSPKPGEVVATSNAYFSTIAEAHTALRKAGAALAADLANYTNIRPVLHVSEVLLHRQ